MNVFAIVFGILIIITVLAFILTPLLVDIDSPLGRWWRRHIADWDSGEKNDRNKRE